MRGALVALSVALTLLSCAHARAQGGTASARARAAYEAADFAGTLAAVEDAEARGHLSGAELTQLLELRALAELATGATENLDRTLMRLLTLDPSWSPTPPAAPRFLAVVEAVRARVVPPAAVVVPRTPSAPALAETGLSETALSETGPADAGPAETALEPRRIAMGATTSRPPASDDALAIGLGVGGGVLLVAGIVTLTIVLSSEGNQQTVIMPVVRWSP